MWSAMAGQGGKKGLKEVEGKIGNYKTGEK